jgi:hypothetical protein
MNKKGGLMETSSPTNLPSTKGKKGHVKMPPDGELLTFTVEDEIQWMQQNSEGKKRLVLQKLRFDDRENHIELRFCYYILARKEDRKEKWVFGHFAPIVPIEDLQSIFKEAMNRGWFSSLSG